MQYDSMQCGVACLQMICEYYHKKYSTNYLSSLCNTTTEGVSMLSIRDTAFALGIESNCGKVNIKGIKNNPLRADANKLARHGLRIVCKSILLTIVKLKRGNTESCHFNASQPIATTSVSRLNRSIISTGKHQPAHDNNKRKMKYYEWRI